MVDIMKNKKFYALLAIFDLVGLLVMIWFGILPSMVGWVLITLVAIPLWEMMCPAFGLLFHELMPGD